MEKFKVGDKVNVIQNPLGLRWDLPVSGEIETIDHAEWDKDHMDYFVYCESAGKSAWCRRQDIKIAPTNSTDQLTQSRIMKATEGLNLEEQ